MKKKLSILLLSTTLCLFGCNNSTPNTTNSDTAPPKDTATSPYITENIDITTADDALKKLKEGNERFLNNKSELINVTGERREQLTDGQSPYAVIISCSDSRITPTTVFNAGLGEIFDIRLAGNVVDDDAFGSIEYGVEHLHTPLIVVMGHEKCGAVTAAYDKVTKGTKVEGNINSIIDKIEPNISKDNSLDEAIHKNTKNVVDEIMDDDIVSNLVKEGKVKIVSAHYSLDGKVTFEE